MKNFNEMRRAHDQQMTFRIKFLKFIGGVILICILLNLIACNSQAAENSVKTESIGSYKNCNVEHVTFVKGSGWSSIEHMMYIATCSTPSVTIQYRNGKFNSTEIQVEEDPATARINKLRQQALSKLSKEELEALNIKGK